MIKSRSTLNVKLWLVFLCAAILQACATLPNDYIKTKSYAITNVENTRINQQLKTELIKHPEQSAALPLFNGIDALAARLALTHMAEIRWTSSPTFGEVTLRAS